MSTTSRTSDIKPYDTHYEIQRSHDNIHTTTHTLNSKYNAYRITYYAPHIIYIVKKCTITCKLQHTHYILHTTH